MTIIHFDIVAFMITAILLVSIMIRKQYKDRTNHIMFVLLLTVFASTIGDLGGAVIGNYLTPCEANRVAMYIFNFIYFVSHNLLMPVYLMYVYSSIDIWHLFWGSNKYRMLWTVPVCTVEVMILLNGLCTDVFSISGDLVYHRGDMLIILYIIAAFYVGWSFVTIFKYRYVINRDKVITLMLLLVMVCAGVMLQMVMPNILIEMFAVSAAIMCYMVVVRREENQIDPLTGALKYGEGVERIERNIITQKPSSIIAIKLNNYRNVYMHLGQENYNTFLRGINDNIRGMCREESILSEIFYFENGLFAVVCDKNDNEKALKLADKIEKHYGFNYSVGDLVIFPEIKQCIISQPEDISDVNVLNSLLLSFNKTMPADSKVCVYSEFKNDRDFRLRSDMDEIISRALERNGLEMYYQPIYSTIEKRFVAAEALIRLNDIEYGSVSPRFFIPAAENSGAIHEIGDFVLREVIRFVHENDMSALGLKYVELNLSASQCIESDLVEKIMGLIEKYKISPDQISLEITETAANINPDIVDMNIEKLHNNGIRFALDDYGTGYSNIKRVVALPVDQVKLDKSFVDMVDDSNMWIVIQDTIKMLKEMGKEVLVEGIEDERVAKIFTELDPDLIQGCELIQGFYFCKPLPKYEFIQFLKEHK